jgi:surfeit locus 1 family protein
MKLSSFLNLPLFTISLGKLEFRPQLIPTLVTMILMYVLISLGQWQLDRAAYKESIQNMLDERQQLAPVDLQQVPADRKERMFLPVTAAGTFDTGRQILLDNQVFNQQVGYGVYTPLLRENGPAVLVKRGWVPMGRTRQDIPDVQIQAPPHRIQGLLAKPPSHGLVLAENVNRYQQWPALVQFIDLQEIESILGYALYPMIIILDSEDVSALHHEPIHFSMGSDKHRAYAFQWFGLATALVIIYLVVNSKRGKTNNE